MWRHSGPHAPVDGPYGDADQMLDGEEEWEHARCDGLRPQASPVTASTGGSESSSSARRTALVAEDDAALCGDYSRDRDLRK